jgi:predicted lysophospholipase L1 biosynthesis ABC-type transport system permease subunit
MTSIRLGIDDPSGVVRTRDDFDRSLMENIDPLAAGLAVAAARSEGLASSRGAVNFGEYFVYFSFFLVVSALMLAALFFKLSVEQRIREVGLLRAVGFGPSAVRGIFMREGFCLAAIGTVAGVALGVAYGYLIVAALGTWWVDAVGTRALTLHVSALSIAGGALGGIGAAMTCIWLTLRRLGRVSERQLLSGELGPNLPASERGRGALIAGVALAIAGTGLLAATAAGQVPDAAGFFGAGAAVLASLLCLFVFRAGRPSRKVIGGRG